MYITDNKNKGNLQLTNKQVYTVAFFCKGFFFLKKVLLSTIVFTPRETKKELTKSLVENLLKKSI